MHAPVARSPLVVLLAGTFVVACGSSDPTPPEDAGTADGDASSADAGLAPIACGPLTCAGAAPYCLKTHVCGYGPADCTFPTSDAGACGADYIACDDSSGKPGCLSAYSYSCVSGPSCQSIGPRLYGNCNC